MTTNMSKLEAAAEAIVFAHEHDATGLLAAAMEAPDLERTAALAAAALVGGSPVSMPLQRRMAATGLYFCAEQARLMGPEKNSGAQGTDGGNRRQLRWPLGLVLGAAAGLALTVSWPRQPEVTSPRAAMAMLLASDHAAVRIGWTAGPSPLRGQLVGEVVWSQERQEGYLTFQGLPPLDADHRFQLWIVDGARTGAPVDGGLFAVADPAAETVVPVHSRLPISKAAAFVVTVESKDGAVVSEKEHIVATASL